MDLTTKKFKIEKTKNFIKKNNFFICFNSINKNTNDWILIEQELKKLNYSYYKVFNATSKLILTHSILCSSSSLINSMSIFLKPISIKKEINKNALFKIEALTFSLLAIKLNNKVYSQTQLKKIFSLNYIDNKLILYKFLISNTKIVLKK